MARAALVLALVAALAAGASATLVIKVAYSEAGCKGDPVSATSYQAAVCPPGFSAEAKCIKDGDLFISESCITAPAFASPWTSLVPASMVGSQGADLTFVPNACGKVETVTVSESGAACTAVGDDAKAVYCKGGSLYSVTVRRGKAGGGVCWGLWQVAGGPRNGPPGSPGPELCSDGS